MPNPNDPKPNDPNTPDPADANKAKDKPTGQSSYEFDFAGSSPELPPVPLPESPDGTANQAALPPRPFSRQPSQGSFDFIDLDADVAALSDPDVQLPPVPPLLTPTPNAVTLPPVPPVPPLLVPTPNAVDLPPVPAPTPIQPLLTPTDGVIAIPPVPPGGSSEIHIELPSAPELLTPTPHAVDLPPVPTADSAADIDTLLPIAEESDSGVSLGEKPVAADGDSGSFVMSGPLAMPQAPAPLLPPSDGVVELPPPVQGTFSSSPDLSLDDPSGVSPLLTPTPNAVDIPPAPAQPLLIPTPNAFEIPPVPAADLVTQYPKGEPVDSDADVGVAPAGGDSGSFVLAGPQAVPTVPTAVPVPSEGVVSLPPTIPLAFTASTPEIDLDAASGPLLTPTPNAVDLPPVPTAADSSTQYPQGEEVDDTGVNFGPSPLADGSGSFVMTGPLGAPRVPNAVPVPTENSVNLPPSIPLAFTASSADIDLGAAPDPSSSGVIPQAAAVSLPDVDLASLSGTDLGTVPEGLIAASLPDLDLGLDPSSETAAVPVAFNASITDLNLSAPPAPPDVPSGAFATSADLNVEPQLESSQTNVIPTAVNTSVTNLDLPTAGDSDPADIPMAFPVDSDEIDLGDVPSVTAEPSSATIDVSQLSARLPKDEPLSGLLDADAPVEAAPAPSLFDFGLDADAAELPPVQPPPEPSLPVFELPPVNVPGSNPLVGSMGSMGSLPAIGSDPSIPVFGSVPDIELQFPQLAEPPKPAPAQPPVGSFPTPDNAQAEIDLQSLSADATASTVGLGQVKPVTTGDWLDSGIHGLTRTDPDMAPPLPASDASDIFSGRGAAVPGAGVEYSDVIKATAYPAGSAADPDVPLGARPAGGTTAADSGDLPVADAVPGSSALLGAPRGDDESIHDLDVPDEALLDSADLAGVRDLPSGRDRADAPDFGAAPPRHDDASSILGGTEPVLDLSGGSAVDIARPGVPAGTFDLIPDEPTEGLFDEVAPSGSNLLESRTRADDDSGLVDPTATELTPDTPSHLLSGEQPAAAGEGDASLETDPELEEAEFNAHPQIRRTSSGDFELPDVSDLIAQAKATPKDDGAVDWDAVSEGEEATRGIPRDASLSALIREHMEQNDSPTQDAVPVPAAASGPEVSIDWQDASGESAVAPALTPPAKKPTRRPEPKRDDDSAEAPTVPRPAVKSKKAPLAEPSELAGEAKKRKGETRSLFAGVLLGGLLASGLAAGAYIVGLVPNKPAPSPGSNGVANNNGGNNNGGNNNGGSNTSPVDKSGWADAVKEGDLTKAEPKLEEARKSGADDKTKVLATVRLGAVHARAGKLKEARDLYEQAKKDFPDHAQYFDALLDKMDVLDSKGAPGALGAPRRLTPAEAERLVLELTVLLQNDGKGEKEPEEPGVDYWRAVKLANGGKYDEAIAKLKEAKTKHVARAKAMAGAGLNPLTDPLEEMFPKACDEMILGWEKRRDYGGLEKRLTAANDAKSKAEGEVTKRDGVLKKVAGELKSEPTEAKLLEAVKAVQADAKGKGDALKKVADELKADPTEAKMLEAVKAVRGDAKAKGDTIKTVADALKSEPAEAKLLDAVKAVQEDAKTKGERLKNVADALKDVKVTVKAKEDELVEAAKQAAARATGDTAMKLGVALDDVKKLNIKITDLGVEIAKTKKIYEDAKTDYANLKTASENKEAELNGKISVLNKEKTAAELARQKAVATLEELRVSFKKDLANAVPPSAALDLWLPVLAELRRKSDGDPAIAAARRARASLATAKPEEQKEIEAKARTTEGMGLLLKADYAAAKEQFQLAVRGPAFAAAKAAGSYWTRVAENGLDATVDPLAPYRAPPVLPPVDRKAAAKALDDGINAYKAGRYESAVTSLKAAVENDAADPVAWFFLGAARWALGDEKQAREDIAQGSERENKSTAPARTISAALAPVQGRARDAIEKARPR